MIATELVDLIRSNAVEVADVVSMALARSVGDASYAPHHVSVLGDIAALSEAGRDVVERCVSKFVDEVSGEALWERIESCSSTLAGSCCVADYDGFCAAVKAKERLLSHHRISVDLLGADFPDRSISDMLARAREVAPHAVELVLDVAIQMPRRLRVIVETRDAVRAVLSEASTSSRCRFKAERLMQAAPPHSRPNAPLSLFSRPQL